MNNKATVLILVFVAAIILFCIGLVVFNVVNALCWSGANDLSS